MMIMIDSGASSWSLFTVQEKEVWWDYGRMRMGRWILRIQRLKEGWLFRTLATLSYPNDSSSLGRPSRAPDLN